MLLLKLSILIFCKSSYMGEYVCIDTKHRFSGVGCLRIINTPPEFKSFKGPIVHTAKWDHSIDFKDKRVALVGSGSRQVFVCTISLYTAYSCVRMYYSAIQTLPYLAENASKVIAYQRSAPWIFPRPQLNYPEFMKWMFRNIPFVMLLHRWFLFMVVSCLLLASPPPPCIRVLNYCYIERIVVPCFWVS